MIEITINKQEVKTIKVPQYIKIEDFKLFYYYKFINNEKSLVVFNHCISVGSDILLHKEQLLNKKYIKITKEEFYQNFNKIVKCIKEI